MSLLNLRRMNTPTRPGGHPWLSGHRREIRGEGRGGPSGANPVPPPASPHHRRKSASEPARRDPELGARGDIHPEGGDPVSGGQGSCCSRLSVTLAFRAGSLGSPCAAIRRAVQSAGGCSNFLSARGRTNTATRVTTLQPGSARKKGGVDPSVVVSGSFSYS